MNQFFLRLKNFLLMCRQGQSKCDTFLTHAVVFTLQAKVRIEHNLLENAFPDTFHFLKL